ncbi:MAG: chemotaxis protein CheC [Syntrophomonadaceae bacterium]|jgi:chemotaxis protein CheC|nr:chemotaxis protein CheC [Syntrophomonadaceae bacterium]
MLDFSNLTGLQLDALKEVGNVGAGNAATALATMTGARVEMSVPQVGIVPFNKVAEMVGGAGTAVVGVYLLVSGSATTNMLFLLSIDKALLLADLLMGQPPGHNKNLDEMQLSAIAEVGNIITGTYLNALAAFTGMRFVPTVPDLVVDMAGAILDGILAQFGEIGDHVLVIENKFNREEYDLIGHLFMLPEPGSLNKILTALGVIF